MLNYKVTTRKFLNYLKNPKDEKDIDASFSDKLKTLFSLFLFSLIVIYSYSILFWILKTFNFIDEGVNSNLSMIFEYSYLKIILIGVVFAPVIEELLFRLPLRYKYNYLLRSLSKTISFIRRVPKENIDEKMQAFWSKYFKYFFFFMAFIFGCAHFLNFSNYNHLWGWILLLVFPQLVIGTVLGYIRVRYSLPWSMAYHAFHNFIFFSLSFLSFTSMASYEYNNKDYSFSMQKGNQDNELKGYQVTLDKVVFSDYKLTDILETVLAKPNKYFMNNNLGEMYVKLDFKSKLKQTNSHRNLQLVSVHIQKALKLKFKSQLIKKEVWVLFVLDSIKYKHALSILIPNEKLLSFKLISRHLDYQYPDSYFACTDSTHLFSMNLNPKMSFNELKSNWINKYGLDFRKEKRELEFINLE